MPDDPLAIESVTVTVLPLLIVHHNNIINHNVDDIDFTSLEVHQALRVITAYLDLKISNIFIGYS